MDFSEFRVFGVFRGLFLYPYDSRNYLSNPNTLARATACVRELTPSLP